MLKEIDLGQDYNVAYRNGKRYAQEIMGTNPIKLKNRENQIKEGGVYVITGGMGGIGLNIASYLSLKTQVKIILINRTEYPDRKYWNLKQEKNGDAVDKLNMVLQIEKNGSSIEIYTADVTKHEDLKIVLDGIRSKHGKINGIIHSAAIGVGSQGKTLKEESLEDFVHVISPKMQGTCLLEELTKEDELDFFVVFSSPITLMGAIGSGSYTAANAYIESFAEARNIGKKNTICISWAPWEKTIEASKESFMENKHMFEVLSTEELIRSFELIMDKDINSVIVGRLKYNSDLFRLKGILPFQLSEGIKNKIQTLGESKKTDTVLSLADTLSNVIIKGREDESYSEDEKFIATVWGNTLGYTELSIDDNFYELGGDSINAMKIINKINVEKNMELTVKDLLSNLTIKKMAVCVENKQAKLKNEQYSLIPKIEKKNYYSASMAQKRMYLLTIRKHRDISWNMSWVFNMKGRLDVNKLEQVFKHLIDRHEILRTSFCFMKNEIVQIIGDSVGFSIMQQELNNRAIDQVADEFIKPFELDKAPLFRVGLFRVHDEEHFLIFDIHHMIADAASMQVMLQDITSIYKGVELPAIPIQYTDYSEWQNNLLVSGFLNKQREYWVNKFIRDVQVFNLPFDYISSEEISADGNKIYAEIGEDLTYELKRLSERMGVSLFVSLVSVYYILIYRFSSQKDITIGVPISGRTHSDLENLIGVFINIIVLKCSLRDEMTYVDLLMAVSQDFLESSDNCDYPFFELVKDLKSYMGNDKSPISNILFVMQNTGSKEIELDSGLSITPYEHVNLVSRNDILLEAVEREDKIQLIFEYNPKLFRKDTIEGLINSYEKIIGDVCGNYNIMIGDVGLLSNS
jgi:short-subunit dehydrogenase